MKQLRDSVHSQVAKIPTFLCPFTFRWRKHVKRQKKMQVKIYRWKPYYSSLTPRMLHKNLFLKSFSYLYDHMSVIISGFRLWGFQNAPGLTSLEILWKYKISQFPRHFLFFLQNSNVRTSENVLQFSSREKFYTSTF